MLFSLIFVLTGLTPEQEVLSKVPSDWYRSTTNLFNYCVSVKFSHPLCPQLDKESRLTESTTMPAPLGPSSSEGRLREIRPDLDMIDYESQFFVPPIGGVDPKTVFQAVTLYEVGRPPMTWLVGLNLDQPAPRHIEDRLWAELQWLWAKILFDQRKFEQSAAVFDRIVEEFKGRAVFHQQRAWAQFFSGKLDLALGGILAAESSLIHPVPYFEKFFLRALIERETCRWKEALNTVAKGRASLTYAKPKVDSHPWVILCERNALGETCNRLRGFLVQKFEREIKRALDDLDLLEIELRDRGATSVGERSTSEIIWPFLGEVWRDELGYYSVPVGSKC